MAIYDSYDRAAAWATAHVLQHPAVAETVISGVSWANTFRPYIKLAYHLAGVEMPHDLDHGLEMAEDAAGYVEQKELAEYAVELNESLNESQSVDIGGQQV